MSTAYTQVQPYIPETDPAFRDWLMNFSTLISADPNKYGLDAADATVIANQYTAFNDAYTLVQMPSTRTPSAVAQKDALRASATGTVRVYAQMIKANGGVDNQDKVDLGIHVNDPTPTPIPTPTSAPIIAIVGATSGQHELRYADENTPASRRKPDGVIQMQLNMTVGTSPATNPDESSFVGLYTKQPVRVELNPIDAGKTASYFARWVTRTGLFGPWSLPQSMTIAFAGGSDAETGGGTTQVGSEDLKIAA
jgi:hypothetical protein